MTTSQPTFAVMGAGAIGGYYGARLATAGFDVSFIARGAHLEAMRRNGLVVRSPLGDMNIATPRATGDPRDIGPVDFVLFMVKLYDTDTAARAIAPMIGPDTTVVSFQNGIDAADRLAAIVGDGPVIGGLTFIPAYVAEPGVVVHNGNFARLVIGERDGHQSTRVRRLANALDASGIANEVSPDIVAALWGKFVLLAAMSGVCSLARQPVGAVLADPDLNALLRGAMTEVADLAAEEGVVLPPDIVERSMTLCAGFDPATDPSLLQDLRRGKRLEVAGLSGAVARRARERGLASPVHAAIYAALKPYADGL
jgi:2-dehydropantoate 2-reductase